jgi:hypothetical protein
MFMLKNYMFLHDKHQLTVLFYIEVMFRMIIAIFVNNRYSKCFKFVFCDLFESVFQIVGCVRVYARLRVFTCGPVREPNSCVRACVCVCVCHGQIK